MIVLTAMVGCGTTSAAAPPAIPLQPDQIGGFVLDAAGKPIEADIRLPIYTPWQLVPTEGIGRFTIHSAMHTQGDMVPVAIEAPGHKPIWIDAMVGGPPVQARLERGAGLGGRLLHDGKPVSGPAQISVGGRDQEIQLQNGSFTVFGWKPRESPVQVTVAGFVPVIPGWKVFEDGKEIDLGTLTLERGRSLELTVQDLQGKPVPEAWYTVVRTAEPHWTVTKGRTSTAGVAKLTGLPDDQPLDLQIGHPEGKPAQSRVIPHDTSTRFTVTLTHPL